MIVTMWMYVTSDQQEADRLVRDVLAPVLGREPDVLSAQLPIGSPEHCVDLFRSYANVGAQQILLWPIEDPIEQLHVFDEHVRPIWLLDEDRVGKPARYTEWGQRTA
jgi:hypothetical protein